jgi:hypothetical protein
MPPDIPPGDRLVLLAEVLNRAVALSIAHLRDLECEPFGPVWQRWIAEAEGAGVFSEVLVVGSQRKGEVARAVDALARALAALAFVPGGVSFIGRHYEAVPAPPERAGAEEKGGYGDI